MKALPLYIQLGIICLSFTHNVVQLYSILSLLSEENTVEVSADWNGRSYCKTSLAEYLTFTPVYSLNHGLFTLLFKYKEKTAKQNINKHVLWCDKAMVVVTKTTQLGLGKDCGLG